MIIRMKKDRRLLPIEIEKYCCKKQTWGVAEQTGELGPWENVTWTGNKEYVQYKYWVQGAHLCKNLLIIW